MDKNYDTAVKYKTLHIKIMAYMLKTNMVMLRIKIMVKC